MNTISVIVAFGVHSSTVVGADPSNVLDVAQRTVVYYTTDPDGPQYAACRVSIHEACAACRGRGRVLKKRTKQTYIDCTACDHGWIVAAPETTIVATFAMVELYNLTDRGRAVGNGWLVSRYMADGRRMNTIGQFGADRAKADAYAERYNGPAITAAAARYRDQGMNAVRAHIAAIGDAS